MATLSAAGVRAENIAVTGVKLMNDVQRRWRGRPALVAALCLFEVG